MEKTKTFVGVPDDGSEIFYSFGNFAKFSIAKNHMVGDHGDDCGFS